MKFTEWFGPILLVLVLANMVFAQDNSADRAAIQGVVASFMDAWNKHDARAFSMVFAEDADFTNVRGVGTSGRESIEKFHEPGFKSGFRNSHLTTSEIKFRLIRPDVASVDVRWEMTGALGCGQQTDSAAQRAPEFHHDQRKWDLAHQSDAQHGPARRLKTRAESCHAICTHGSLLRWLSAVG